MVNPFEDRVTYVSHTGIELTEATPDIARGKLEITENHHQPYGVVHGGVYCTLAETIASTGAAVWAMEQGMAGAVGVSNTTDFLRATASGGLLAEATPIHRGRSQQLWEVNITSETTGKLVAHSQIRLHNVTDLSAF